MRTARWSVGFALMVVATFTASPATLRAQQTASLNNAHFFGYGGGGGALSSGSVAIAQFGIGGETREFGKAVSFTGEGGFVTSLGSGASGTSILAAGLVFSKVPNDRADRFFFTGGAIFFPEVGSTGGYLGLGLKTWASDRFGVRFEIRDQIVSDIHLLIFRIGVMVPIGDSAR